MIKRTQIYLDKDDIFQAIKHYIANKYDVPIEKICNYNYTGINNADIVVNIQDEKLERKDAV